MKIKFKKLSENATIPTLHHPTDAGLDLFAAEEITILPATQVKKMDGDLTTSLRDIVVNEPQRVVPTDIAWEPENIPEGYKVVGIIKETSGNAMKVCLKIGGGVVDQNYRGPIGVIIYNFSPKEITIAKGAKIGQLVPMLIPIFEVEEVDDVNETDRGSKGFGSSGVATDG
jgi:dUTP pyrophosphatase